MTDFGRTIDRIREVSADVADDAWDTERNRREIACWSAVGSVTVQRGDVVSLELDGLTCEQAVSLLRALRETIPHQHEFQFAGQVGPYDLFRCTSCRTLKELERGR